MGWRVYGSYCPRCGWSGEILTQGKVHKGTIYDCCPGCGYAPIKVDYGRSIPRIQILDVEGWWEHIAEEPIYIRDKKHLMEECQKRGLTPRIALDGFDNPLRR